jgi:hypothetical protein
MYSSFNKVIMQITYIEKLRICVFIYHKKSYHADKIM